MSGIPTSASTLRLRSVSPSIDLSTYSPHPPKVPAVVHGQGVGLAFDQVGRHPQPGDPRLAVQMADHLEHFLDGRADDAMSFNADHRTWVDDR